MNLIVRHQLILVASLIVSCAALAQDSSTDTSGAQAAIQALQASRTTSPTKAQAFPALKAAACKSAVPYVESEAGLLGNWDQAMRKYKAYSSGATVQRNLKSQLQSEAYWRTSSVATIANDIHTFCKLTEDVLSAAVPEGNTLKAAINVSEDFGSEVSKRAIWIYQSLEKGDDVMNVLTSGTDELLVWAAKDAAKQAGYGRATAIVSVLEDTAVHIKTANDAAEYKATVQQQLHILDDTINQLDYEAMMQREKLVGVEALKDSVVAACNADQPTQTLSAFQNAVGTQQIAPQLTPKQAAPSVTSPPWWTNIKIPPSAFNHPQAAQTKPTTTPTTTQNNYNPECPPNAHVCK